MPRCIDCNKFVKTTKFCKKYKTSIINPCVETDCRFFWQGEAITKGLSERQICRPNTEFRKKKGNETVGGLLYTKPYWYKNNQKKTKKVVKNHKIYKKEV